MRNLNSHELNVVAGGAKGSSGSGSGSGSKTASSTKSHTFTVDLTKCLPNYILLDTNDQMVGYFAVTGNSTLMQSALDTFGNKDNLDLYKKLGFKIKPQDGCPANSEYL